MDERTKQPVDPGTKVESTSRRAEDIGEDEQEAGRQDSGPKGPTDRPSGTSSARDYTGVNPKEPKDGGSPAG